MTASNIITDCRAYGPTGVVLVVGLPGEGDDYFLFGSTVEVRVGLPYASSDPRHVKAEVSIGGIAAHSLEVGYTRADVYKTACDLGTILLGEVRATLRSVKGGSPKDIVLRALRGLAAEFTFGAYNEVREFIEAKRAEGGRP